MSDSLRKVKQAYAEIKDELLVGVFLMRAGGGGISSQFVRKLAQQNIVYTQLEWTGVVPI